MIGHLKGTIIDQDLKSIILDVSGVGYKVFTNTAILPPPKRSEGNKSSEATASTEFWTFLAVRENALDLYGFTTKEELHFFELLMTVSGIGPKSAMSILSVASIQNLKHAIANQDISHLTKVSGVGKKNAEKIVLELKDKLDGEFMSGEPSNNSDVDALEALKSLGYGEREVREALKKVKDGKDAGEKIRKALKLLS
jgi:Holliday junction DNA helicase RuvA